MSSWFRFYDDALHDPKVQKLDGDTFKAWVNLLCVASKNGGRLGNVTEIAFHLRCNENAVTTLIERLSNATLIDRVNGGANGWAYAPHGWEKRQFKSDSSAERVKRHRERYRNVTVTPQNRADTDIKKTNKKNPDDLPATPPPDAVGGGPPPDRGNFDDFWENWPKSRRSSRPKAQKSYEKAVKRGVSHEKIIAGLEQHRAIWGQWLPADHRFIPHPATWLNQERWNDPPPPARPAGRHPPGSPQPPKPSRSHAKEF